MAVEGREHIQVSVVGVMQLKVEETASAALSQHEQQEVWYFVATDAVGHCKDHLAIAPTEKSHLYFSEILIEAGISKT